jgi:hypothetical protein
MPNPVSANNPSTNLDQFSMPAEAGPPAPPTQNVIELDEVRVEGDAGTRALLADYAKASRAPAGCAEEGKNSLLAGGGVAVTVLSALAATNPIGVVAGVAGIFYASVVTGKELRSYSDCEKSQ